MPTKITSDVLSWASIIDEKTSEQAATTGSMPFVNPHLALMPDAHLGKGATVGSVIPTERAIIPAAVGVDIGCGMIAVRTQWTADDVRATGPLATLREGIEQRVPVSAGVYNKTLTDTARARVSDLEEQWPTDGTPDQYAKNWRQQLGTLGGGNHFIEITADETGTVWAFLHSGSRGVGNKIAQHHIKTAQAVAKRYWIDLPDPDLAYLVEGTMEFDQYIAELRWAQDFALANRAEMMDRTLAALAEHMGQAVERIETIQCHHNWTDLEHHMGRDLWISRKGAIRARVGDAGLIPGSMGTASYVVEGKGNTASFCSAPHGAGREYSRTAARKKFTADDLRTAMAGIEYRDSDAFIDEIPAAYKDIDQVMADAADLVDIRHTLHQIVNVKGD
ncbi:RtcB family protein [Brachybacterium halotolerans subsp. kimchii]|uniref:RtcB family protein n=1 Tax=Brachybacterium halotolerans TaxID=2795215 RepID=UPI001E64E230|nr:RtcB family protein [Brachybacterium halotolerans]UEJ83983.1 RtcB family protein [Brachybacterium halotolerans subsp. kimchii]